MRSGKVLRAPLSTVVAFFAALGPASTWAVTFSEQGATILGGENYAARSVSLADIDNDGDLDAFFQGGGASNQQMLRNNIINNGGVSSFTFTNVTSTMVPAGLELSWSAGWADYDGDGRVDVFVGQTNNSPNSGDLLRNNGSSFSNESTATHLNDPGFHQNVGWADFDNDRDLDLIIGMEGPELHEIYLQGAGNQFTAVGAAVGIQVAFGQKGYGLAIGDPDSDGDFDVYISTCSAGGDIRNNFFKNMLKETGTLSFVDIADSNGTQNFKNTYGTEFIDFDNDNDLDLYVTGADGNETKVFRNDGFDVGLGQVKFTDVKTITGHELLRTTSGTAVRGVDLNGSKAVDYDNDGDLDLYFHDNMATSNQKLFRNDGNWNFVDVTTTEGLNVAAGGAPVGAGGYDSVWGDLDRDGDQDLIDPNNSTLSGNATPERLYVSNASANGNHWLYVDLTGPAYDTTGLGASLYATTGDGTPQEVTRRREANTNIGTFNQSDLPVHFGLGAATLVDELRIVWPDGTKQSLFDVAVDKYLSVQYLPGDYNGNGIVDTGDYTMWRDGLGTTYTAADYDVWRSHFGQALGGSGGLAGVPEPASMTLLYLALASIAAGRPRRN